jgi:hypothetical protein
MTCPSCQAAEQDPRTGLQHVGCMECAARALAQSPEAWRAVHAHTAVGLIDAIDRVFGVDNREDGKKRVWAWIKLIRDVTAKGEA